MKTLNRREILGCSAALVTSAVCTMSGSAFAQSVSTLDVIRKAKVLKIGVVADGEPNFHKDPGTGKWSGIYIDFANSLASSLNAQFQLCETTWGHFQRHCAPKARLHALKRIITSSELPNLTSALFGKPHGLEGAADTFSFFNSAGVAPMIRSCNRRGSVAIKTLSGFRCR
ncbi:putative aBC amino acid transporter, periplasmic ligand binding protein [Paraburkholderia xenovorans LB400]|nr:hypothetical protein [Paraburkholderia xenovorans]AIP31194.1 putative aBC amino acid transporter, periplasmic ligand binding protein [Paraburkholderia xenovorans LB400]